ncbi:EAL domain-containing protein [Devosia sp. MC1541]|uniref:bifunctional diguanylate cyclase/phosphodiesterase n=1 Tax=Devosia sp. MC1541 TaxID=2725264 RepID=UPI001AEE50C3|nr:EAL domain-containing protein [Devosia sp. MC1541]
MKYSRKLIGWHRIVVVPILIALALLAVFAFLIEQQNQQIAETRMRAEYISKLSVIRTKLESNIQSNLQLLKGMASALAADVELDESRFRQLAAATLDGNSQIRAVTLAPDMVVRWAYPRTGNEDSIGFDYRTSPEQWPAVQRMLTSGESHFVGPLALVQGGVGFVARYPIFDANTARLWGIVSAVVDGPRLLMASGIIENRDFDLSLTLYTREQPSGQRIFGQDLSPRNPVYADVNLTDGQWRFAVVPKNGWVPNAAATWALRVMLGIAGALILLPILLTGRMVQQRQNHIREIADHAQELDALTRRFHLALDVSKVGVWEIDLESGLETWDARTNFLYGTPNDGKPRRNEDWLAAVHPEDRERASSDFKDMVSEGRSESTYRVVRPDGGIRYVRSVGAFFREEGRSDAIIGVNFDITADVEMHQALLNAKSLTEARNKDLEAARISIEHNALHDSLTGLPNRRYLDDMLKQHLQDGYYGAGSIALLHIDLDRFKQINDTLGHAAGDAMLVHAAEVLRFNCHDTDFVARIGGDEFVIVSSAGASDDRLTAMADKIVHEMRKPVLHEGHECRFGVSVGLAVSRSANTDVKQLLINADIALYRAKARGRNRYEFFTQELQSEVISSKRIADEILSGLENHEFIAFYQPQVDARTLAVTGVEALVRWHHPTEGLLTPDRFMRIADELNVVSALDSLVLRQVLADLKRWDAIGLHVPHASVNVSLRRLNDETLGDSLKALDIEPGRIAFELVESIYLDESDSVVSFNIERIKQLGIDIEIDDFGTGYASIVSLQKLRPRRLKIDRQLVAPIVDSLSQRRLVDSIVDIGKSMDIDIVAEGVETMEHAAVLRDLGCDILQGYALGRPMSREMLESFLRTPALRHTG